MVTFNQLMEIAKEFEGKQLEPQYLYTNPGTLNKAAYLLHIDALKKKNKRFRKRTLLRYQKKTKWKHAKNYRDWHKTSKTEIISCFGGYDFGFRVFETNALADDDYMLVSPKDLRPQVTVTGFGGEILTRGLRGITE